MQLDSTIKINTERLILKPISEEFISEVNQYFTTEITVYMPYDPDGNKQDTINFIQSSIDNLKNQTEIVFVILNNSNKEFIGCCGIHNINSESVKIGLWIKKDSQSKGFGKETVTNLLHFIEANFNIDYIIYPVDEENIRSRKIPEGLGFEEFNRYLKPKNDVKNLNIIEYRKYYNTKAT